MSIKLQGERIVLRDVVETDIDRLYFHEYESEDLEHHHWNGPYYPREPNSLAEYTENELEKIQKVNTHTARNRLVIEIEGELKGIVSRYWVSEETNWMEIGIVIYDSTYWSGGYGTEAFQMWIHYLFNNVDTVRLGISTWSGNERMRRLASKCGMMEEACIRKARIVRGEYYDAIKMGILREEWEYTLK